MVKAKTRTADTRSRKRTSTRRAKAPSAKAHAAASDGPHLQFEIGNRVHVKMGAPAEYRGQSGEIVGAPEAARYEVALDDGPTVPLHSWWLERA